MNWRTLYQSFNTILALFVLYQIIVISLFFHSSTIITTLIVFLIIGIYFWFGYELNQVLVHKKQVTKKLRSLEYVCYVLTLLFFVRLILIVYSTYMSPDILDVFYDLSFLEKIVLSPYLRIIFLTAFSILSIMVFAKRKKELGTYDFKTIAKEDFEIRTMKNKQYQTHEERIKLCLLCANRKIDTSKGMLCGITDEKPNFETFCNDYKEDEKAIEKKELLYADEVHNNFWGSWMGALLFAVFGFIRAALKGLDDPFGIIFLSLGIVWLAVAVFMPKK